MAVQELTVSEMNQVSGAAWDEVDWLAAGAAALAAAATGGFGWAAAAVEVAVQAVNRLPSGGYPVSNFTRDMDTAEWILSGYYD